MSREITVRDAKQRIYEEAKSEFKAKLGNGVESAEKKLNSEAQSETEKKVKEYLAHLDQHENKTDKSAAGGENRGMDSLLYDRIDGGFKARVKAQLKGFDSEEAEKKHGKEELGNAEHGTDDDVKVLKDKADAVKDDKVKLQTQGLVSSKADKGEVEKRQQSVHESTAPYARLKYKHTRFLSEGDVKKHIPDNYKVEGRRFYMLDNQGNDYLVEWSSGVANIIEHKNDNVVTESLGRIKELMNYNGSAGFERSTNVLREGADNDVRTLLNKTRQMGAQKL